MEIQVIVMVGVSPLVASGHSAKVHASVELIALLL